MIAKINNYNNESKARLIQFQKNWNKIGASNGSIIWAVADEHRKDAYLWLASMKAKAKQHQLKWFWVQIVELKNKPKKEQLLPQMIQGRKKAETILKEVYATDKDVLVSARNEEQKQLIIQLNKKVQENFKFIRFTKEVK